MAYNSYYMASLSYGTVATSLNIKECEAVQRPVLNVFLPKNEGKQKHDKDCGVWDKQVWQARRGPLGRCTRTFSITIRDRKFAHLGHYG
jgi:hypothetical protein